MKRVALALACIAWVGLAGGCADDACEAVDGNTFKSTKEQECGLGPNGVVTCKWTIAFADGSYTWTYSDLQESGTYTCDGERIIGASGSFGNDPPEGTYDFDRDLLTWDGLEYGVP